MHPILFSLGPFTVYTYGVMLVAGFLLVLRLAAWMLGTLPARQRPATEEQLTDLLCLALFGGLAGGRLLYIALHWQGFLAMPLEMFAIWHGGLVWYGGFAGGVAAVWWYARRKRLPLVALLDFLAPLLALGHGVGRLGCFLNGCCYGRPTASWCGVTFPGHDQPVIPTQLFEAAALFGLYAALWGLQRTPAARRGGTVSAGYLVGYGIIRFIIEGFRGDQTVVWAGLTLQQMISVGLFAAGLAVYSRRPPARNT